MIVPQPFQEALETISDRIPTGSPWDTAKWASVAPHVRERAFFSANVESVRFLQRAKDFISDYLAHEREMIDGVSALRADGRARFVREMMQFAIEEGLGPIGIPMSAVNHKDVRDIRSEARLSLIFDTQVKQAFGFGYHKQGQEPEILWEFPAARFVRHAGAKEFRPRHVAATGEVRLKDDREFWLYQNAAEIGGFQTMHPPYGFHSRMDQEDVSRAEAEELGLLGESDTVEPDEEASLNESLKASLKGIDPGLRSRLEKHFKIEGETVKPKRRRPPIPIGKSLEKAKAKARASTVKPAPWKLVDDDGKRGKIRWERDKTQIATGDKIVELSLAELVRDHNFSGLRQEKIDALKGAETLPMPRVEIDDAGKLFINDGQHRVIYAATKSPAGKILVAVDDESEILKRIK